VVKRFSCSSLCYASAEVRADKQFMLAALKRSGKSLEYASAELKADKEVVLAAVAQDACSLELALCRLAGRDPDSAGSTAAGVILVDAYGPAAAPSPGRALSERRA
jgi:hypothetical protein